MNVHSVAQTTLHLWEGFQNQFINIGSAFRDHYILMPSVTIGLITLAALSNPISLIFGATSFIFIGYKANQASTLCFLEGNREKGLEKFGETVADIFLFSSGLALGKVGQAIIPAKNGSNPGMALHLVDEAATAILLAKKAFQQYPIPAVS